ncbi:MAG: phage terminase large subunit, partial [Hungatella sp.]
MTFQDRTQVRLSDLIASSFYALHWDIAERRHTHYKLAGGRGSTKSSFISIEMILGMMQDAQANAIVMRKVGRFLEESVFEQLLWAIDMLG